MRRSDHRYIRHRPVYKRGILDLSTRGSCTGSHQQSVPAHAAQQVKGRGKWTGWDPARKGYRMSILSWGSYADLPVLKASPQGRPLIGDGW